MNKGFFFFQFPNSTSIEGYEGDWTRVDKIENCKEGFVMTTFNKEQIFSMSNYSPTELERLDEISLTISDSIQKVDKVDYEKTVNSAIEFCKVENGKVVMSRIKRHELTKEVNLSSLFQALCSQYTHAFNYLCHIPGFGTWIGASPEQLLVGVTPHFQIASLAGSRSIADRFEWSEKEIHEQELVTESIESTLKRQSVTFSKTETKTIQSGNVEHLFTGFNTENCFSPLLLAEQLHPTPAVSGFPKETALNFINSVEPHERELYAGIVGVILKEKFDLYVNLRSAKIHKDSIDLFVGGGITASSVPSDEWGETEFKSQTLLSIIEKM